MSALDNADRQRPTAAAPDRYRSILIHLAPLLSWLGVFRIYRFYYGTAKIEDVELRFEGVCRLAEASVASSSEHLLVRLAWGSSAMVYSIAWLAAVVVILMTIHHVLADRGALISRGAVTLAAVLTMVVVVIGSQNPLTLPAIRPLLESTFAMMKMDAGPLLLGLFTGFGLGAAMLLVLGSSATLTFPRSGTQSAEELRTQILRLRRVLYAGAAVLVTGVLQMAALHRLPIPFFAEYGEALRSITRGLTVATGTLWTLFLLAIYLPAALILGARARKLARHATGDVPPAKRTAWLKEHGLGDTWTQQLGSLTAILAPLLTGGPLMSVLNLLSG